MIFVLQDCLERPRKIGAKFTGANFAPDEFVQPTLDPSFDGKRDRWNGYDNEDFQVSWDRSCNMLSNTQLTTNPLVTMRVFSYEVLSMYRMPVGWLKHSYFTYSLNCNP